MHFKVEKFDADEAKTHMTEQEVLAKILLLRTELSQAKETYQSMTNFARKARPQSP